MENWGATTILKLIYKGMIKYKLGELNLIQVHKKWPKILINHKLQLTYKLQVEQNITNN